MDAPTSSGRSGTGSISVILPVRNGEAWIGESVRSLLDQTLPPSQILVGDDGSTDGTVGVLEAIGSPLVELVRSPEGMGIPRMCNDLVARARHRFLARMDADDICLPERFQVQVDRLSTSDVGVLGSWARRTGISRTLHSVPLEHDDILAKMGIHCPFVNPTVMFDRDKIQDPIAYDPSIPFGGDYELFVRLRKSARMANIGRVLLLWRHHERNVGSDRLTLAEQNRTVSKVRFSVWEESGIVLTDDERQALDQLIRLPLPTSARSVHLVSAFGKALRHPDPRELWAPRPALRSLFQQTWDYYCRVIAWSNPEVPRLWYDGCKALGFAARPGVFAMIVVKSLLHRRLGRKGS